MISEYAFLFFSVLLSTTVPVVPVVTIDTIESVALINEDFDNGACNI